MEARKVKTYEFVFNEKEALAIYEALDKERMLSELQDKIYSFIHDTIILGGHHEGNSKEGRI